MRQIPKPCLLNLNYLSSIIQRLQAPPDPEPVEEEVRRTGFRDQWALGVLGFGSDLGLGVE